MSTVHECLDEEIGHLSKTRKEASGCRETRRFLFEYNNWLCEQKNIRYLLQVPVILYFIPKKDNEIFALQHLFRYNHLVLEIY